MYRQIAPFLDIMNSTVSEFSALLEQIDATQQSIQSTSKFFSDKIAEKSDLVKDFVVTWAKAMVTNTKKVELFYLANDIIQREKDNEKLKALFSMVMPRALQSFGSNIIYLGNAKKVLNIWGQRQVFPHDKITEFLRICA